MTEQPVSHATEEPSGPVVKLSRWFSFAKLALWFVVAATAAVIFIAHFYYSAATKEEVEQVRASIVVERATAAKEHADHEVKIAVIATKLDAILATLNSIADAVGVHH
jgi:hypothetical protein